MTNTEPLWRELDNWREEVPEVELPERLVWHLYGPRGEVLLTFSDRPPTGFHQGERSY